MFWTVLFGVLGVCLILGCGILLTQWVNKRLFAQSDAHTVHIAVVFGKRETQDLEYQVRCAVQSMQNLRNDEQVLVLIVDEGLNEEQRLIARLLCEGEWCVYMCTRETMGQMVNFYLQSV